MERGIPEHAVDRFAEHLRFAIWTTGRRHGEVVGQFGGLPRLPLDMAWPSDARDGGEPKPLPLPFIASFDCAALPKVDELPLPVDGSLLFFLEHEYDSEDYEKDGEPQFARVVHVPAGTATAPVTEPPAGHDEWALSYEAPFTRPESELFATVCPELPGWLEDPAGLEFESGPVQRLFGELTHVEELRELVGELWPREFSHATVYLGGYSMELGIGDNPESHIADSDEETLTVMREWLPLAQFQTRDDVYYGRFMIRRDDLAAGRFDRVLSFTMFTE